MTKHVLNERDLENCHDQLTVAVEKFKGLPPEKKQAVARAAANHLESWGGTQERTLGQIIDCAQDGIEAYYIREACHAEIDANPEFAITVEGLITKEERTNARKS